MDKIKVARVSTVPFFILTQLKAQIDALCASGMDVTVIASHDELSDELSINKNFSYVPVNIERDISPLKDVLSLVSLFRVFRRKQFNILHSTTPKAGLLCAMAGYLAGVSIRLHTFTGQTWVTTTGFKRVILKYCDKIIARLNTHCYADSESQRAFLVSSGIIKAKNISVVGKGSLAGIDLERFDPYRYSSDALRALRTEMGITESGKILLFVGRVTPDKGIRELISAFGEIVKKDKEVFLILVGPFESSGENILKQVIDSQVRNNIKVVGYSGEPEKYMALADILCLPSYREGFGTVVIEAAAMGTPTVGTDIYGLSDAIVNGETGVLVAVKDSVALEVGILGLLNAHDKLLAMGSAARHRAITDFSSENCSKLLIEEYKRFFS